MCDCSRPCTWRRVNIPRAPGGVADVLHFYFFLAFGSDQRPLRSRPVYNSINRGTKHCVTRSTFQKIIGFSYHRAPTKGGQHVPGSGQKQGFKATKTGFPF